MLYRFAILLLTLPALACSEQPDTAPEANAGANASSPKDDSRIPCAIGGAAEFERVCSVEQVQGDEGLLLTIRAPEGGFRRLQVVRDGRGVIAADGSQPASVTIVGDGTIEVAIGRDRYRLPATVQEQ